MPVIAKFFMLLVLVAINIIIGAQLFNSQEIKAVSISVAERSITIPFPLTEFLSRSYDVYKKIEKNILPGKELREINIHVGDTEIEIPIPITKDLSPEKTRFVSDKSKGTPPTVTSQNKRPSNTDQESVPNDTKTEIGSEVIPEMEIVPAEIEDIIIPPPVAQTPTTNMLEIASGGGGGQGGTEVIMSPPVARVADTQNETANNADPIPPSINYPFAPIDPSIYQATNGVPRIPFIFDWRRCYPTDSVWSANSKCPAGPGGWSAEDVITLMETYPDYLFNAYGFTTVIDLARGLSLGEHIRELLLLADDKNINSARFTIQYRNDVMANYANDNVGCAPNCNWGGNLDGRFGEEPFNTDWVMKVPTELHEKVVNQVFLGVDPFDPETIAVWPSWMDKDAITALNTEDEKVAIYGAPAAQGVFRITAIVMDLRIPEYRTWSVRHMLYGLEQAGFGAGRPVTILTEYKPGWHTYYDGPVRPEEPCYFETLPDGTLVNMWTGPGHLCDGAVSPGGLYHPTQYGPGEFENAISAWYLEAFETLEDFGYEDFYFVSSEQPNFRNLYNSTLSSEVIDNPHLLGTRGGIIYPEIQLAGQPGLVIISLDKATPSSFLIYISIGMFLIALSLKISPDFFIGNKPNKSPQI